MVDILCELCLRVFFVLNDIETVICFKLAVVLKQFLIDMRRKFLKSRCGSSVLDQYASDCTPFRSRQVFKVARDELHTIRYGTSSKEWLVQRAFLRDTDGNSIVLFEMPRLMVDKTAWSHWQALTELCHLARQEHSGITNSHRVGQSYPRSLPATSTAKACGLRYVSAVRERS